MWFAMHFYLNLAYSVKIFSQFCSNHKSIYIKLVKYILYYVFRILYLSLIFDKKVNISNNIIRYIDSNFAKSKPNQKLTKNYIFIFIKAVINYSLKF